MKKIFIVLGLLLIATMLFVGCGETDNTSTTQNNLPPQDYNKTGTLQGKIMDALTGAALGNDTNSELKIWLIQGTDNRGPSKLINDNNDPLVGEYAFSGIPVDINTGEIEFKVVVVKPGYQRFEANVGMLQAAVDPDGSFIDILNSVINMIGNIYLFPLNASAGAVTVTVKNSHGTVIPNVTVLLQQDVVNNNTTALIGNRLSPSAGLITSLTGTTNTSGVVTFAAANLVLGGAYIAIAEGMDFGGEQLATKTGTMFRVGVDSQIQYLTMSPPTVPGPLYAVSASNDVPGTITADGVLTITFNQPIILSTTGFTGTLSSTTTGTVGSVTGALNTAGTILTITPTFSATPTGAGATITYTYGGTISLKNTQGASGLLFDSTLLTTEGVAINRAVQLITK